MTAYELYKLTPEYKRWAVRWKDARPVHRYAACLCCGAPTVDGECASASCPTNQEENDAGL